MANNNQNQRIVFSEGSNSTRTILEILKKNGLEEPLEDELKKIKNGIKRETPRSAIIDKITKELAGEKISTDKAIISLQEQLKTSKETAEKILEDIKIKLVPLTEKFTDKEDEEENLPDISTNPITSNIFPKIEPMANVNEQIEGKTQSPIERPTNEIIVPAKKQQPRIKKPIEEIKKSLPQTKQPKGQDNYREPIN